MVVVVGSVNVDVVAQLDRLPTEGETRPAQAGWIAPGGKGGNQAVAAARQSAAVTLVSVVGQDALAATALATLREVGVRLAVPERPDVPTGMALVWLDAAGRNTIAVVPGANASVDASQLEALDPLQPRDVVLISLEIPLATAVAAAEWARAGGARVLVDPAPAPAALPAALWHVDVLMPNQGEAEHLLGHDVVEGHEEEAARELHRRGAQLAIVKLGGRGLVWSTRERTGRIDAWPIPVVDTTGAGDAFAGALAANLATGREFEDALWRATRVAALACTRAGAQTVPTWADVQRRLGQETRHDK
ncbi:MAG: PfkB family carbohydrate kinase [Thermaerobacter sp.]|nr:PfkB family carbohydrate kinase [Thermaerobacter sp.]